KGYTISGLTFSNSTILGVNYYDDYAFLNTNGISDAGYIVYDQTDLPGDEIGSPFSEVKGLLTGTLTAQFDTGGVVDGNYLHSVKYYDNRDRVLQVADKVPGGTNRVTYSYD